MDRNEWLKARKSGLGGSDVAAVVGLSKYKTAFQVWQDKTTDEIIEIPDNQFMKWGRKLEDVIASAFAEETGREVVAMADDVAVVRSKELPFMIGSVDRYIVADPSLTTIPEIQRGEGILEAKTVNVFAHQDWQGEVPPYYYAQLMHYLYVTGLQWGAFAILIGGNDFRMFVIERDEEYIQAQVGLCREFWEKYVVTNTPPPRVASDFARSKLLLEKPVLATTELLQIIADAAAINDQIKTGKVQLEAKKVQVQEFMGDHTVLVDDGQRPLATWKPSKGRKTFNTKQFTKDHPDLAETYTIIGEPSRRFSLKGMEE